MGLFGFGKKKQSAPPGFEVPAQAPPQDTTLPDLPAAKPPSQQPPSFPSAPDTAPPPQEIPSMPAKDAPPVADVDLPFGQTTPHPQEVPDTSSQDAAPFSLSVADDQAPSPQDADVPAAPSAASSSETSFEVPDFSEEEMQQAAAPLVHAPGPTPAKPIPPSPPQEPEPVANEELPAVFDEQPQPAQESVAPVVEEKPQPQPSAQEFSAPADSPAPIEESMPVRHEVGTDIYVEKREYQQALLQVSDIQKDVHKAADHVGRVIDDENIITSKITDWHGLLNAVQEKLILIDTKIFEGETHE